MRSGSGLAVEQLANTRISILRGTEVDEVGDMSDVGIPIYQHMQAALILASMTVFDPSSSTRRTSGRRS